jgi:hypothetical protein
MPDLKYLYRVLYIAFLNKLLIFFLTKLTIKSHVRQTTGEHLGHLKDLEISKYKRESKGR